VAKKQRWKSIRVSDSSINAKFFNSEDVRAFEQGSLSVADLLNSERIPQELPVQVPLKAREFIKNLVKDLELVGSRCMYPNCQEEPVKAHILSKASWLGILSESNNVLKINENMDGVLLSKVPITQASTESCFCSEHDNDLFRSLDESQASIKPELLFKLAYRLLCGNTLATENFLKKFQPAFPDKFHPLHPTLKRQRDARQEYLHLKKLMDEALLEEDWNIIKSRYWEISTQKPTVAAAGARTLDDAYQKGKNDNCHVFVSVIPRQTETLVVISSIKKDSEIVKNYLERIGVYGKSGQDSKISLVLSKLLLKYCKYVCFRPSFVETKSRKEWMDVLRYWRVTDKDIFYDMEYRDSEVPNLFV